MNKEIRDLFDRENIITKKITIKKNVRIIESNSLKFVIKRRDKDLNSLFKYLTSRSFNNFPKIIYQTDNYDIYEYLEDTELPIEQRSLDIIKLTTMLHSKTTFYKEVDEDYYKKVYEDIHDKTEYLTNYYNDIATIIEKEEYMSPSNYLFIRNISKVFQALNYCRYSIDKWYEIISQKKRIRIVNIHNNLSLDHYIASSNKALISWRFSKRDLPIYDILKLYKKYYTNLDFCELLRNYEIHYPLLPEEKNLFFCLISMPEKIEFTSNEYALCQKIKHFYDYLNTSEKFISDYFPTPPPKPNKKTTIKS